MKNQSEHPLKAIRRAGVPLVAYETSDPAQTILSCVKALNGKAETSPVVVWDIMNGQRGMNEAATGAVAAMGDKPLREPSQFLSKLAQLAGKYLNEEAKTTALDKALVFVHNGHLYMKGEQYIQALWNLRDVLKAVGATVVLLCPGVTLPAELQQDVVVISEPLPDHDEMDGIVDRLLTSAGIDSKKLKNRDKVVDTLLGVSAFAAEQALAMSISADGKSIDTAVLFEHKRKLVEQTPGLSVWRGKVKMEDVKGLDNLEDYMVGVLRSKTQPVTCIAFCDEVEKMFAGAAGDMSGVSQDQMQVFLRETNDRNIDILMLIGPGGTGKSEFAKACSSVADAEMLSMDFGAMTNSLVGGSQERIRKAFATFNAIAQNHGIIIMTCNRIAGLPPELRRRVTLGTFFVDLPEKSARKKIWGVHLKRFGFDPETSLVPNDEGWTGAEIRACCANAYRTGKSLLECAKFIVPISQSASEQIEELRRSASGKYVSANHAGVYKYEGAGTPTGRKFEVTHTATVAEVSQQKGEQE
jgi:hypothetical protein